MKFNVSQGVARLDFARIENYDNDKKEITMTPHARLILPIDSFMQFAEQVARIKEEILSKASSDVAEEQTVSVADDSD